MKNRTCSYVFWMTAQAAYELSKELGENIRSRIRRHPEDRSAPIPRRRGEEDTLSPFMPSRLGGPIPPDPQLLTITPGQLLS